MTYRSMSDFEESVGGGELVDLPHGVGDHVGHDGFHEVGCVHPSEDSG